MIDGPLQVLFYALTPNSQLLRSKPGNGPLLQAFDEPVGKAAATRLSCYSTSQQLYQGAGKPEQ